MPRSGILVQIAHGAHWGGTERHLLDLSIGLKKRGYPVRVILSHEGVAADRLRDQEIPIVIVGRSAIPASYIINLKNTLKDANPRLVHVHCGRLPALAARLAGVQSIIETRHGLGEKIGGLDAPDPREGLREDLGGTWVDATIAVCESDAEYLTKIRFNRPNRVFCVPNGIDCVEISKQSHPEPDKNRSDVNDLPLRIGFLGRLCREKGLIHLIHALAEHSRPFHLDIAGTGPLENELREVTRSLNLTSRVRFIGFTDSISRYISSWDLVALPSIWEGLPYAALESLAWGRPIIATRVGGLEDLIKEGEWGWLASPGETGSLVRALGRIPWNRDHLGKMGEKGRQFLSQNFSLDQMVEKVLNIYERVTR